MYIPIKLKPDSKVRGWKPSKGWYCCDSKTRSVTFLTQADPYLTKKECKAECERFNKNNSEW